MPQLTTCGCSNSKGCDVIVITIETCCKKTCLNHPISTFQNLSGKDQFSPEVGAARELKASSKTIEKSENSNGRFSAPVNNSLTAIEKYSDDVVEKEITKACSIDMRSDSRSISQPSEHVLSNHISPEHILSKMQNKTREELTKKPSFVIKPGDPKSGASIPKQQRLFTLPIITERHHGTGCAMEISVLEKHENLCVYKKNETEGRSIDDRVGSYDCIGRLVFKTCNADDVQSKGSGISGTLGSGDKFLTEEESSVEKTLQEQALEELHQTISESKAISQDLLSVQSISKQFDKSQVLTSKTEKVAMFSTSVKAPDSHPILEHKNENVTTFPTRNQSESIGNIKPLPTHYNNERSLSRPPSSSSKSLSMARKESNLKSGSANLKSLSAIQEQQAIEPTAIAKSFKPLQSNLWHRHEQIMYTTMETKPNKGYKFNSEQGVFEKGNVLSKLHFKKELSPKKNFSDCTDECNQTDPILNNVVTHRLSQDTVGSLSSLSTSEQRKKFGFFTSFFTKKDVLRSGSLATKRNYRK